MSTSQKWLWLFGRLGSEFRRAIQLGKQMLHAGHTNIELKDTLSELGLRTYRAMKNQQIHWDDSHTQMLITKVDYLEKMMHDHEAEIKKVKVL